jgi:hypothetical protein
MTREMSYVCRYIVRQVEGEGRVRSYFFSEISSFWNA